jgi:hypothetical protein
VFGPTNAEREHVVDLLKSAVSDARLTVDEFQSRLDATYAVASRAELDEIVASVPLVDLPSSPRHRWVAVLLVACLGIGVGVGGLVVTERRDSRHGPQIQAQQVVPRTSIKDLPAQCQPVTPFPDMQTAVLNQPVALALPDGPDVQRCASVAGLTSTKAQTNTIHVHLDLELMSNTVPVPNGLGVDPASGARTQIFTDNDQGVVTVAQGGRYRLGQLFAEWGHPLTPAAIGNLRLLPDFPVSWFVNGKPVSDGAGIRLRNHEEIQGVEDLRGSDIEPTSHYAFPPGY